MTEETIESLRSENEELRRKVIQLDARAEQSQAHLKVAAEMSHKVQEQNEWIQHLGKELNSAKGTAAEADKAIQEAQKLRERVKAAENARAAAERKEQKERFARNGLEGELEELKQRIVELQEQPSRLKRLRDEVGL
jgi:chromosome segregation ATPase